MTTIVAVKHAGHTAFAGDGQVTLGDNYIMKGTAQKVRPIYPAPYTHSALPTTHSVFSPEAAVSSHTQLSSRPS